MTATAIGYHADVVPQDDHVEPRQEQTDQHGGAIHTIRFCGDAAVPSRAAGDRDQDRDERAAPRPAGRQPFGGGDDERQEHGPRRAWSPPDRVAAATNGASELAPA